MYNIHNDLLEALRATPDILEGLLRETTQEQARTARGGDEEWSVVEVICHLRDAEEYAVERLRAMRDTVAPHLAGYDQERWAVERNYAAADLRQALAAFIHFRRQHIGALEALPADQWERTGQHEEQGQITISSHTLHIVSHTSVHTAQIARQLLGVTG